MSSISLSPTVTSFPELDDHKEVGEPYVQQNQVFFGDGKGNFEEALPTKDEPFRSSRGTAVVDLDDNGALDVIVNNMSDSPDLYLGRRGAKWIRFRLIGTKSNRDGLGAVVDDDRQRARQQKKRAPL